MIKRIFDIVISLLALIALLPILLIVAVLVRIKLGHPVLFVQTRPGKHAAPFQMYKFRTMIDPVTADGSQLSDSERLTKFGHFLRASSLDELPGLWNVVTGKMSLVGPRPLAMAYLELYSKEQFRRHDVRPGITGWAQVNGRNEISWKKKFEYDVWYVDNQSVLLDLKILFMTLGKVILRQGVKANGQDEVVSFDGSN